MFQFLDYLAKCLVAGAFASAALLNISAADAATERVVHSFSGGTDGIYPSGRLINVRGILYGLTSEGGGTACGGSGCGTVYSVNAATGVERIVYSFQGGSDGASPVGRLHRVGNILYGMTSYGGGLSCSDNFGSGCGTVFSVNLTTGVENVLHAFLGGADGRRPSAGVIGVGGVLFSTTDEGGGTGCNFGCGTVFSLNPQTGAETVVHSFRGGADGQAPEAPLLNVRDTLYGTTRAGGDCPEFGGCGTVFSLNPTSGAETVVYSFQDGTDGYEPEAGLTYVKGDLYGTTAEGGGAGGSYGCGTVFSINLATGAETVVYSFQGFGDGCGPGASLKNISGALFGTTYSGGAGGKGTVFKINRTTGAEMILYSFEASGGEGAYPASGLLNAGGALYGTTVAGGGCDFTGCGTVFEVTLH